MTRKITATARVDAGLDGCLHMGNLDCCVIGVTRAIRGDAVVDVAAEKPDDFVIATGRQESVRRFIELTAQHRAGAYAVGGSRHRREWVDVATPEMW